MTSIQDIILEAKKTDYLNEIYASPDVATLDQESLSGMFQINDFKVEKFKGINRSTSLLSNDVVAQVFNDPDIGKVKK